MQVAPRGHSWETGQGPVLTAEDRRGGPWVHQSGLLGLRHTCLRCRPRSSARSGTRPFLPSTLARGSAPRTCHLNVSFLRKGNINVTYLGFESISDLLGDAAPGSDMRCLAAFGAQPARTGRRWARVRPPASRPRVGGAGACAGAEAGGGCYVGISPALAGGMRRDGLWGSALKSCRNTLKVI